MRSFLLSVVVMVCCAVSAAEAWHVSSPDGLTAVTITLDGGVPTYDVTYAGQQVILPSRLGLTADVGTFSEGLAAVSSQQGVIDTTYTMWQCKASTIRYHANTIDVELTNSQGNNVVITFAVSDNNIAFRYTFPMSRVKGWTGGYQPACLVVESEQSAFRLPESSTAFVSPQITAMGGWERTKPSYEEVYSQDAPIETPSAFGEGYTFPCLFRVGGAQDVWVLISETGVDGGYVGSHLSDYDALSGYTIAFPQAGETNGVGSATAGMSLPGSTPWRTITVGSLKAIAETTVTYDVVEPKYETKEYVGGRYTWSWIVWQDNSINYDDQVAFIDVAAAMGYEYCLVDCRWDTEIGYERMAELSAYAQSKNVKLLLWYNSNGYANDAPYTPKHKMNTTLARRREMAWLQSIGVAGIKVDFFGGDKQATMQLYEDILVDANDYGLAVIFHGCTLPRGWERMYPNFVAAEAVLASENVYFTEEAALREARDLCLHPFCRNAIATMDWGGTIMNHYLHKDNKSRHRRHTTNTFEMAVAVVCQSAVQCIAMQPNNLSELTATELSFLRDVPTEWDETRLIDGYPGQWVVLARRSGQRWVIAGLNAGSEARTIQLSLPMLSGRNVMVLEDSAAEREIDATTTTRTERVSSAGSVTVTLQPNGGCIIDTGVRL